MGSPHAILRKRQETPFSAKLGRLQLYVLAVMALDL